MIYNIKWSYRPPRLEGYSVVHCLLSYQLCRNWNSLPIELLIRVSKRNCPFVMRYALSDQSSRITTQSYVRLQLQVRILFYIKLQYIVGYIQTKHFSQRPHHGFRNITQGCRVNHKPTSLHLKLKSKVEVYLNFKLKLKLK